MKCLSALAAVAVAAAAGAAITLYAGWYDISATDQHLAPTYWALHLGMRRSVERRAQDIHPPPLDDAQLARGGYTLFHAHCMQCHGAPGIAPEPFALGLTPTPANLMRTASDWPPAELFWPIKHGIKMTGRPAWAFRMGDEDIWAVVAFLQRLPKLTPSQYRALAPTSHEPRNSEAPSPADPRRGAKAIHQSACVTCHRIPGTVGANAPVGPPLDNFAARTFIAGIVPNTGPNLVGWLLDPRSIAPDTVMPNLGLSERGARDIAAYLHNLK